MLHAPIFPAAAALQPPPLKPDEYLNLRRRAAGLSIVEVARLIAPSPKDHAEAVALVAMLEAPGCRARFPETIEALQRAYPLDLAVYRQLADEPADRHPTVCRSCGCSEWDPCHHEQGTCGWASTTKCTRCAEFAS
ncbi:hypothetical protein [Sphingomonas sp. HMP6]|uniref:hypothetical protein n=1 Tax=Sphingomonas sp. HMP6 TaxID=1517551 RepID=UPI00159698C0|nr:hypothetical protein [Sphingomonas sp. HMP6]BCA60219.1 hypothetical protein HMP06_2988 [Sphingomonas sp. HMP6]